MKKIIILLFVSLIITGCSNKPDIAKTTSDTPESILPAENTIKPNTSEETVALDKSKDSEEESVDSVKIENSEGEIRMINFTKTKTSDIFTITIDSLPENIDEFKKLAEDKLNEPENTCALFLMAINLFVQDKDIGIEALNILKGPVELSKNDKIWYRDRLMDKPYLPMAYFEGATPENSYEIEAPYVLKLYPDPRPQDTEEGFIKLYVKIAGADSPRYFKLREKDGNWYIWEEYSIMTGVKIPANLDPWS